MTGPIEAMVVRAGTVTPCCDRVPLPAGAGRYVCRGCGTLYADARATVEAVFGCCADVTAMTPSRWIVRNHRIVRGGG